MADLTRIQFKRSKTPNVRPAPDTVAEGEIILNLADRAILTKLGNEIIDLGFAKGGKVDGNIDLNGNFDQKNGHFNTTGNVTVGGTTTTKALSVGGLKYSGIDIRQDTNKYIRLENTADGSADFAILWKRDADDSNLSSFQFPTGHGMGATQQWVNTMVNVESTTTILRNPNGTNRLCLVAKDTGEAGAYDYANRRWAFVHNQAGFEVFGSGAFRSSGDYASVILKKSDNRFVQIETYPHASTGMLNFIYREADGKNIVVNTLPAENGTIASREWTNLRFRRDSDGVVITPLDQNEAGWWQHIKTDRISFQNGRGTRLNLSDSLISSGAEISVKSNYANADRSRVEVTAPDGQKSIGLWAYNDGRTLLSAYASGAWSNITIGGVGNGVIALREWVNTNYHSNLAINNQSSSWISMRDQPCFRSGNPVATASASCILRQEHADRHFMIGGLGNTEFGIYMINKNQVANDTNGRAWMDQNGGWNCNGGYAATQQWVNSQGFSKGTPALRFNNVRNISSTGGSDHGSGSGAYSLTYFAESMEGYMLATRQTNATGNWTEWTGYALYKPGHAYYENSTTLKFSGGRGIRFQARIAY